MKLQFKETKTNTFLVSNEPIKAGKIITAIGQISDYIETVAGHIRGRISSSETHRTPIDECFKIIAQVNPELPIEQVPLFEIKQEAVDLDKLARDNGNQLWLEQDHREFTGHVIGFKQGFVTHQELNKEKRFSKEQINIAIDFTLRNRTATNELNSIDRNNLFEFLQSNSTPTLDGKYCEIETTTIRSRKPDTDINGEDAWIDAVIPKLTPEGKIQVKLK